MAGTSLCVLAPEVFLTTLVRQMRLDPEGTRRIDRGEYLEENRRGETSLELSGRGVVEGVRLDENLV